MNLYGWLSQFLEIIAALALAPLLTGWVNQCRAWLQNKSAPSLFQPYRLLHKLFNKESTLAEHASPLFRAVPYIVFGCMALATSIIPTLSAELPLSFAADAIALVGLFALARVFISLAAMDIGTSFGTLGARREMLIGFLAEPALLMVLFSASLISQSTSLSTIVETLTRRGFAIDPSLVLAGVAFTMVLLAENARVPVDNPATHLELTMIHEALILEYSARHLALMEWAASLKLFAYACAGLALFFPWGIAETQAPQALLYALPILVFKLAVVGAMLAALETASAKMRIFRVPEFLATAFMLAVIAMLVHILLAPEISDKAGQVINVFAAALLMLAFAMISQRRILTLIHLFILQGVTLVAATAVVGFVTHQPHLYLSAGITLLVKVILIPVLLHRVIDRLNVRWDVETLINIPTTMLVGILLVIFAFNLAPPIAHLSSSIARGTLGIALACVLLSLLMMITRSKAVPQVIGFLSMENGLFFAATSATYGMPMVVELGIALDVLVGVLILGVFMFQIREQFDILDIRHLEMLKKD